ncbi:hypothetical protein [Streptomyces spinosisporus]|uniref:UL36 very large tegument protein n=1 Tax=Streptomyces spinosisporus TaxID=2927582 RepID=A0ABS9X911_9ACTN|nr:hypothetical protein [Streptomyces spinosisporus]MCI3238553.1 hypothetical protein [Streptomyces spinosisporus]
MAVEQLPGRVREFANYLNDLLARLDQGGGWCAVFWQRDPDGMRACLDGREMPPWDVVEALLQDFATVYGPRAATGEQERARPLHAAAMTAYDDRPGGREALGDRLDVMLREQRYAAERQAQLSRLLTAATTRQESDTLRLDLAWAHDDHERATARCAELRHRMAELNRRSHVRPDRGPTRPPAPGQPHTTTPEHGPGPAATPAQSAPTPPQPAVTPAQPAATPPQPAVTPAQSAATPARPAPTPRPTAPESSATFQPAPEPSAAFQPLAAPGPPSAFQSPSAPGPSAAFQSPAAPEPTPALQPPPPPDPPASLEPQPPPPTDTPSPAPKPKQRKRRRGGARFAGLAEEDTAPVVVPPGAGPVPVERGAAGRTPRGARFAGAAAEVPAVPEPQVEAVDAEGEREVAGAVVRLVRLRAEGRSGEAHMLLAEAAQWPPARYPLLADALQRAGLGADWATLLWETVSLPVDRLVAVADALVAAGRGADGEQILRQGVARPATDTGRAVLALAAEGRHREVRVLLDAYVRARTPEEAARSAEPDPQTLVPLLLEAAQGVSEERHWDLVHALRVAGFAP